MKSPVTLVVTLRMQQFRLDDAKKLELSHSLGFAKWLGCPSMRKVQVSVPAPCL